MFGGVKSFPYYSPADASMNLNYFISQSATRGQINKHKMSFKISREWGHYPEEISSTNLLSSKNALLSAVLVHGIETSMSLSPKVCFEAVTRSVTIYK